MIFGKDGCCKRKMKPPSLEAGVAGEAGGLGVVQESAALLGWVWAHLKMFGFIPVPVQQQHII